MHATFTSIFIMMALSFSTGCEAPTAQGDHPPCIVKLQENKNLSIDTAEHQGKHYYSVGPAEPYPDAGGEILDDTCQSLCVVGTIAGLMCEEHPELAALIFTPLK